MKKNNRLVLTLIILIVMVGMVLLYVVANSNNESTQQASEIGSEQVQNETNISTLKQSEYTNDAFDSVEIGDSFDDVESKMGELTAEESATDQDIYGYEDENVKYEFYFSDDTLANVTVLLINNDEASEVESQE